MRVGFLLPGSPAAPVWWFFGILLHSSYFWYCLFFLFFSIKYDVTNDISPITACGCHSHSLWHPNKAAGNRSWHTDAVIFITFLSVNNCVVRYLFSLGKKGGKGLKKSKKLSHWGGGRWFPTPSDQCSCTSPSQYSSPEVILLWPQLFNSLLQLFPSLWTMCWYSSWMRQWETFHCVWHELCPQGKASQRLAVRTSSSHMSGSFNCWMAEAVVVVVHG